MNMLEHEPKTKDVCLSNNTEASISLQELASPKTSTMIPYLSEQRKFYLFIENERDGRTASQAWAC